MSKDNLLHLDNSHSMLTLMKREYGCDKFMIVALNGNNTDTTASFMSNGISELEFVWMIDCLKERRRDYFED